MRALVWSLPASTVIDEGQKVSAPLDSGTQWVNQTKWEAIDYIYNVMHRVWPTYSCSVHESVCREPCEVITLVQKE